MQVLIHRSVAIRVDLTSFAFTWPNSIICPFDLRFFGENFRQDREKSRSQACPATPGGTTAGGTAKTALRTARAVPPAVLPLGLAEPLENLKILKIVLAISFDFGLRFWCSSARFEATIKAYITIAVAPSSTTTKIRGQAPNFYNKG